MALWDSLVDAALATLAPKKLLFNTQLISLAPPPALPETFAGPGPWDRDTIEIQVDRNSLEQWLTTSQFPQPSPAPIPSDRSSTSTLFLFLF